MVIGESHEVLIVLSCVLVELNKDACSWVGIGGFVPIQCFVIGAQNFVVAHVVNELREGSG